MAHKVTLDSIRDAAEAKYGSYDIDLSDGRVVRLLNPLRLTKERRDDLNALGEISDGEGEGDEEASIAGMIRAVAQTPEQAEALLGAVNGDLAVLVSIIEGYSKGVQLGEASASQA